MDEKILDEESYFIDIYYDVMLDLICFVTRYRFQTKELAQRFFDYANNLHEVTTTDIQFENDRSLMGYDEKNPYRPRFITFEDAVKDFQLFLQCRNIHNIFNENQYKYNCCTHIEDIGTFENISLTRENERLKNENQALQLMISNMTARL